LDITRFDIGFAWDSGFSINVFPEMSADVLVVVGYSFPNDNEAIDSGIIRKLRGLRRIFVQDRDVTASTIIADKISFKFGLQGITVQPVPEGFNSGFFFPTREIVGAE
jgi:hypothetical protein